MRRTDVTIVPPAACRATSLVVAAVLSLASAGAAQAFTVEIVLPSTDPLIIAADRPQAFEAVAYDDQQQDITRPRYGCGLNDRRAQGPRLQCPPAVVRGAGQATIARTSPSVAG